MPRRRTALPRLVRKVARRCSVHVVATVRPSPHLFMSAFAQPAPTVHTPWPALRTLISGTGPLLAARAPRLRWPGADNDPPVKHANSLHHLLASGGAKSIPGRGRYVSLAPGSPRCPVLVATVPGRSPGDFHSTGAPYVPRNDSRGTKPARATSVTVTQKGYIKGLQALRNKYTRKLKRAHASCSFSPSEARPHGYDRNPLETPGVSLKYDATGRTLHEENFGTVLIRGFCPN